MVLEIKQFQSLPIPQNQRKCTDISFIIIPIIFALALIITAISQFNLIHLYQITLPTDSDHKTCGYDLPSYPYVYFTSPQSSNIQNRVCASKCPEISDGQLYCSSTSIFNCNTQKPTYQTYLQSHRLGFICHANSTLIYQKLLLSYNLHQKMKFLASLDVILITFAIGLGLSIFFLIFIQFIPVFMMKFTIYLGPIFLIALWIIYFSKLKQVFQEDSVIILVLGVIFIILGISMLIFICFSQKQIQKFAVFIHQSTVFLGTSPLTFIYIPIYLCLTVCLFLLIMFQYLAFSSNQQPRVVSSSIYLQSNFSNAGNAFNIIQLFWGIFFLRNSFFYCISGNTSQWYITKKSTSVFLPSKRILSKNLGSIFMGSLIDCLFFIPQFICDIVIPTGKNGQNKDYNPCLKSIYCCCGWLINTIHLVRNDCYSIMNLVGNEYVVSCRQAQYLNDRAQYFGGNSKIIKIYWFGIHFLMLSIVEMTGYWMSLGYNKEVSGMSLLVILVGNYFIISYFMDIFIDSGKTLLFTFMYEYQVNNQNMQQMKKCPLSILNQLKKMKQDITN